MKIISTALLIIAIIGITNFSAFAQNTIVQWTFPTNSGLADQATIPANLIREIETAGGTSAIQFKNVFTTKAAQKTGWDNSVYTKKWKEEFETTSNLISSADKTSLNQIDIYPNPANNFIVVHTQTSAKICIYNINGRRVIATLSGGNKKLTFQN